MVNQMRILYWHFIFRFIAGASFSLKYTVNQMRILYWHFILRLIGAASF